jgi:stress response protein YsnF
MSRSIPENITQEDLRIPVVEEQLTVGTRVVETGRGVRIHKTISEQPVVIDERLVRDEMAVERVPVDRIVALEDKPVTRYEGDTLVVPVFEEVLVVERRLRIKEELRITRIRHEERYQDTVSLKAEQVEVERFDDAEKLHTP